MTRSFQRLFRSPERKLSTGWRASLELLCPTVRSWLRGPPGGRGFALICARGGASPVTGSGEPGWTTRDAEPYGAEDALYLIGLTYPGCGTYRGPVAIGRRPLPHARVSAGFRWRLTTRGGSEHPRMRPPRGRQVNRSANTLLGALE